MDKFNIPDNNFHRKVKELLKEINQELEFSHSHINQLTISVNNMKDKCDLLIKKIDNNNKYI